jgi:hypothetical protein
LRSLVLELAVVHDLGHGRLGFGGNFDEVEVGILCQAQGNINRNDSDLLAARTYEANFGDAYTVICTGIADASLLFVIS